MLIPGGNHAAGRQLLLGGEGKKRRKCGKRADFPPLHQLWHGEHTNRRARINDFLSIDVCDDRVCRAQIDADQITRRHRLPHLPVFSRMFSSSFQRCVPSRDTHQTSRVPSSVKRVSIRTGTNVPCWPSSLSVTSSGLSSSMSLPQSSSRLPT